jgi:hypothetical protein
MKDHKLVEYGGKKYCVCRYQKKDGTNRLFIIDATDLKKVLGVKHSWYCVNGYIGYAEMIERKLTHYYLHNLVMNKPPGGGKGQKYTIDHITRNPHDNRKANLRLITQSAQNENQKCRERKIELPDGCGIKKEDLPKCVYYYKARDKHGERFTIELKKDGQKKTWSSSSSVKYSLKDKFIEIKKKLLDVEKEYPELMENKSIIEDYSDEKINLMKEFNEIIKLSGYECADDNLVEIPKKKILKVNVDEAGDEIKHYLKTTNTAIKTGRRHINNIPAECGITGPLPKFCYYYAATDERGDAFVIDRHPALLSQGIRQWKSSDSKNITAKEKYEKFKLKLAEIEKAHNTKKVHNTKKYTGSKTSKKKSNTTKKYTGSKTSKKKSTETNEIKKLNNSESKPSKPKSKKKIIEV